MANRTPFYGTTPTTSLQADHVFMSNGQTVEDAISSSTTPTAADVSFTPTTSITSDNVQAAIEDVDDKMNTTSDNLQNAIEDVDSKLNYSENEVLIGKWIDGKDLYRSVIDFGALPNNTTKTIAHGIANIDTITRLTAIATTGATFYPIPFVYDTTAKNIGIYATLNNISIYTGNDRSSYNGFIILEYTKTT